MPLEQIDPDQEVHGPAGPAPVRPPRSIRRTTTIDMTWPRGGFGSQLRLTGSARDAVTTDPAAPPQVVVTASTDVGVGPSRVIESISATPDTPNLDALVGCRGGGYLRAALDQHLPTLRPSGAPLYLLLDDISGTSLIAGVAWSRWIEWPPKLPPDMPSPGRNMEGVCIGFRPGSSALTDMEGRAMLNRMRAIGPLHHEDDEHGWHEIAELPHVATRRARRIDVWRADDGSVVIDAGFQDSVGDPDHERMAVHEYEVRATASADGILTSLDPVPRVLPFRECPSAVAGAQALVGTPLSELRQAVLERLARTNGCTHLNDAIRALADVPHLLDVLDATLAADG